MDDKSYINSAWPDKEIVKVLGRGSYGVVYECHEKIEGIIRKSAVKVIELPANVEEYNNDVKLYQLDSSEKIRKFYENKKNALMNEVKILEELKTSGYVVTVYSYKTFIKDDVQVLSSNPDATMASPTNVKNYFRYKLLIEMELLESITDYFKGEVLNVNNVVDMAIDVCRALNVCHKRSIIHRDIKDSNIFVSEHGTFKIGDFGISRHLCEKNSSMSQKGTENYMAPEVFYSRHYDERADIYSLGMVIYRLLNGGRPPYVRANGDITIQEVNTAFSKRISGGVLPPPDNCDEMLSAIVLKSTAFAQEQRYNNISDLMNDLILYKVNKNKSKLVNNDLDCTIAKDNDKSFKTEQFTKVQDYSVKEELERKVEDKTQKNFNIKKSKKRLNLKKIITSVAAIFIAVILLSVFFGSRSVGENVEIKDYKFVVVDKNNGVLMTVDVPGMNGTEGYYAGKVKNDKPNGEGAFTFLAKDSNVYTYSGTFKNGAFKDGIVVNRENTRIVEGSFNGQKFKGDIYRKKDNLLAASKGEVDNFNFNDKKILFKGTSLIVNLKDNNIIDKYSYLIVNRDIKDMYLKEKSSGMWVKSKIDVNGKVVGAPEKNIKSLPISMDNFPKKEKLERVFGN